MTIIFDFNRTLFDPETGLLLEGAQAVLAKHHGEGKTLHLISRKEGDRDETLERLGIKGFFTSVSFVEDKHEALRQRIASSEGPVYIVGDHLHTEIRFGNRYGAKTVWLKRGRFSNLLPETDEDIPWRTIGSLMELNNLPLD